MINPERVYLMWEAQRKVKAMNGFASSASFAVARRFRVSCAEVRRIVEQVREERASR